MTTTRTADSTSRRSTRISQSVMMTVTGIDGNGEAFTEQTGTLELELAGLQVFLKALLAKEHLADAGNREAQSLSLPPSAYALASCGPASRGIFRDSFRWASNSRRPATSGVWPTRRPIGRRQSGPGKAGTAAFQYEMNELLSLIETGNYYQLLQVILGFLAAHRSGRATTRWRASFIPIAT